MKVEKLAKNGEKGQNYHPLSPGSARDRVKRSVRHGLLDRHLRSVQNDGVFCHRLDSLSNILNVKL